MRPLVVQLQCRGKKTKSSSTADQSLPNFHIRSPGKQFLSKRIVQQFKHPFHIRAIREAFPSILIYDCSVNVHNYYSSLWVGALNTWAWYCSRVFTLKNSPWSLDYCNFSSAVICFAPDFSFNCSHGVARIMWSCIHVILTPRSHITFWSFLKLK